MPTILELKDVDKSFQLHLRAGTRLSIIHGASFHVDDGECVVLRGPSGSGKSSLLKMIYGTYPCDGGSILVQARGATVDVAEADARSLRRLRRDTVGYVSQFLRAIPRVAAIDIVAEPLLSRGLTFAEARRRAGQLLSRLYVPERLWSLPPATFSGGEQQRVNIARGFAYPYPLMLLDEPTASLDAANRQAVLDLIDAARAQGAAILGIFHDADVRKQLADRVIDAGAFAAAPTDNQMSSKSHANDIFA